MMLSWQQITGRAACTADPLGTRFYEEALASAGGSAASARIDFLTGRAFANCDVVSTHIDASLLDAMSPELLGETLIVWNTREPFSRLVSEYSHNWLWSRSTEARRLSHVTFDEFVAATYEPPPPGSPGDAPAAAGRQAALRRLVGPLPSMVLQHAGLRLANPTARRLTGFTGFGQEGADGWAAAPVPPGHPPRPQPGQTGPVDPSVPAWDTGGADLLAAALQRLETRVCAVIVMEHQDAGVAFLHHAMGWPAPGPLRRRNTAAELGRLRNVTGRELAGGLASFAASEGVDEALYRIALARHHLQQDALLRRDGVGGWGGGRDDPALVTVPAALALHEAGAAAAA